MVNGATCPGFTQQFAWKCCRPGHIVRTRL